MCRSDLRDLVARHAPVHGVFPTPIEGLRVFRVEAPIERLPGIYPASLCCVVAGTKRLYLGGRVFVYDEDHYLCATLALPVEAEVPTASRETPVLGVTFDLDTPAMTETRVAYEAAARARHEAEPTDEVPGLCVGRLEEPVREAVGRLLELLDDPVALRVLAPSRVRELGFALLEGAAGPLLRRATVGMAEIAEIVEYLRTHVDAPVTVEALARRAGMSRAVFHRRFKAATNHSPLQFVKALRLHHAALRIAAGEGASEAARAVGYASASQFSREFSRRFGMSPRSWRRALAAAEVDPLAAAI
ncbi:MAG: AraC family transcriptional regulator [Deltaproteobacteria bacterium]|nr:MAG: AraC family transcriptional regulator [Deltaproteobacteria bacterium]